MSIANARRALISTVTSLGLTHEGQPIPVLTENDGGEPPERGPHLRLFGLPDATESCGKSVTDNDFRDGTFQVSVFTEKGTGTALSLDLADAINKAFYHGSEHTCAGTVVTAYRVELEPSFRSGAYWHQPISIDYQVFTERT